MRWYEVADSFALMPPRMTGTEWADAERILGDDENVNRPGRWRTEPWQREILDALADPQLDWIVVQKAAQMGVSELIRCAVGRWARLDPGDVLWVMATMPAAKKAMRKLHKMFANTPTLKPLLSTKKKETGLLEMTLANGMRIVIGWAGSPQSLASDPFRYVVLDETGLYPPKVGKEGSPIRLAEERTKTFGRRAKIVLLSKPAHPDDLICTSFDECLDKRDFTVPCEVCGDVQPFVWDYVRWDGGSPASAPIEPQDRARVAARVELEQSAWIECRSCGECIGDPHEIMHRGMWATRDGERHATRRRAYHVSEMKHWAKSISDLVARYLRCIKPGDVQGFWTGSLGLPYIASRGEVDASLFSRRAIYPAGLVPKWATIVLSSADTQKDHFYFMTRAWGVGGRSRLLDFGRVATFAELEERALLRRYRVEPKNAGGPPVPDVRPTLLVIDAAGGTAGGALDGSRTNEVYKWAHRTAHVMPLKGDDGRTAQVGEHLSWGQASIGGKRDVVVDLARPNTNWFKDQLIALIRAEEPVLWEENELASDPDYGRQMTGQRLIREEDTRGNVKWKWKKISGRDDHYFDCAAYQVVAAEITMAEQRKEFTAPPKAPRQKQKPPSRQRFATRDGRSFLANWR